MATAPSSRGRRVTPEHPFTAVSLTSRASLKSSWDWRTTRTEEPWNGSDRGPLRWGAHHDGHARLARSVENGASLVAA